MNSTSRRQIKNPTTLRLVAITLLLLGVGTAAPLHADSADPSAHVGGSVAELIRPDGSLNLTSYTSSALDLIGWAVTLDPQRGPLIAPAAATSDTWSALSKGVSSSVNAIAVHGGNVYVGGGFLQLCGNDVCNSGNTTVGYVAKWNGAAWSALDFGLNSSVLSLAVMDDPSSSSGQSLYAGGDFTQICGNSLCDTGNVRVNGIVKWDGNNWSSLDDGLNGQIYTIELKGGDLYAGGSFTQICANSTCTSGGTTANRVAKWNGSSWSSLSNGLQGAVLDISFSGSTLYAGGGFTHICGNAACNSGNVTANRIGQWNGSAWSAVGNGVPGIVQAVTSGGGNTYIGGTFTELCGNAACNSGNVTVNRIAKWNGTTWSGLGNGFAGTVIDLVFKGGELYAGGGFLQLCGNLACNSSNVNINRIAKWNSTSWGPVENGFTGDVYTVALSGSQVFAGGAFKAACGPSTCLSGTVNVNYVAKVALPGCEGKPPKPELKKPGEGATVNSTTPRLKWHSTACADTYTIDIRNAEGGEFADKAAGLTKTTYKANPLPTGILLKWFVKACNTNGCKKSVVRHFTVE